MHQTQLVLRIAGLLLLLQTATTPASPDIFNASPYGVEKTTNAIEVAANSTYLPGILPLLLDDPEDTSCLPLHPYQENWTISGPTLNIRDLGALGNGVNNDTGAFQQAAEILAAAGGGKLFIPAGTYIVGQETHIDNEAPYYQTQPIFKLDGVNELIIEGEQGTILRLVDGLHFGAFDPDTGEVFDSPIEDFANSDYRADGGTFIEISGSTNVWVSKLELDGNLSGFVLGGHYGDTGRQLDSYGLLLESNRNVLVENIHSHHNGLDGISIGYEALQENDPATPYLLSNVLSEYNARQGLSLIGGRGITIIDSQFNHTGRGAFYSSPGAGIDIEAEQAVVRDGLICGSEFINNTGVGILTDTGDGGYTRVVDSLLWGTTEWALWTTKPGMVFENSRIYGSSLIAINSITHPDPALAPHFSEVEFEDLVHPDYGVFDSDFVLSLDDAGNNVTFEHCRITANTSKTLWSSNESVPDGTIVFRDSVFTHKNGNLEEGGVQSFIRNAFLENVTFEEEFGPEFTNQYFLELLDTQVGDNVVVTGPVVSWEGLTGLIPKGNYSSD